MLTVTVSRKWWLRGKVTAAGGSYLLRKTDGKMCCLGFMELDAFGLEPMDILGLTSPEAVYREHYGYDTSLSQLCLLDDDGDGDDNILSNTDWIHRAMAINDDTDMDDDKRERLLKTLFEDNGYNLIFVD